MYWVMRSPSGRVDVFHDLLASLMVRAGWITVAQATNGPESQDLRVDEIASMAHA